MRLKSQTNFIGITLSETNEFLSLKIDAWKMSHFPFATKDPIFRSKLLVSGRVT